MVVLVFHVFVGGVPPFPGYAKAIMRIAVFNGDLAIWVFFLVSGFSLSASFVRFRDRRMLATLASRRYLRLGIPILFYSLLVYAACRLSLIPGMQERPGRFQYFLTHSPSMLETLRFASFDVFFRYSAASTLLPPLWTMPFELFGSFLVLGALALTPRSLARFCIDIPIAGAAYWVHPIYATFIVGALMAEVFIAEDMARAKALLSRASGALVLAGCGFALALPDLAREAISPSRPASSRDVCSTAGWEPSSRMLPAASWAGSHSPCTSSMPWCCGYSPCGSPIGRTTTDSARSDCWRPPL